MIRPSTSIALLLLPAVLTAAVVEDFSTPSTPTVYQGEERGATCALAVAPKAAAVSATQGDSLVLHLAATHHALQEVYFAPMRALPGPGTVTMRVLVPDGWQGLGLSLRVRDGKGEVFQFKPQAPVAVVPGTWSEVRFAVDEEHIQGHWGPDGSTGHLAGAWVLAGIACSIGTTGAADLWFDDLAFSAAK